MNLKKFIPLSLSAALLASTCFAAPYQIVHAKSTTSQSIIASVCSVSNTADFSLTINPDGNTSFGFNATGILPSAFEFSVDYTMNGITYTEKIKN